MLKREKKSSYSRQTLGIIHLKEEGDIFQVGKEVLLKLRTSRQCGFLTDLEGPCTVSQKGGGSPCGTLLLAKPEP